MQITKTTQTAESLQKIESEQRVKAHTWLSMLVRELFQTEQSAIKHPVIEADRLGDVPPARALRAVAAHAESALAELPTVVKAHDLPKSDGGKVVGSAFSFIRDHFADMLLNLEKSYRGTLLGMRHGMDLVELVRFTAQEQGDLALEDWCSRWLEKRKPLIEGAARELAWFAANPERAAEPAKSGPFGLGIQMVVHGLEQMVERLDGIAPKSGESGEQK